MHRLDCGIVILSLLILSASACWGETFAIRPLVTVEAVAGYCGSNLMPHSGEYLGRDEIIAINDYGIDREHPSLAGALIFNPDNHDEESEYTRHGTFLAGVIAGRNVDHRGIAPEVKLFIQTIPEYYVTEPDGRNSLFEIFDNARRQGAYIQNNSWGIEGTGRYSNISATVDAYVHRHPEVALVFACGSNGAIYEPATAKNVISVGELGGNYNPLAGNRRKPDVTAFASTISAADGGGYVVRSGSSVSAAIISGTLGILREYYQRQFDHMPSAALLKATLINGRDEQGMFDLDSFFAISSKALYFEDSSAVGLQTGDKVIYEIDASGNESLNITLAWTDEPAIPNSNGALINDLDLCLETPNGDIIYGNMSSCGFDRANNTEKIVIQHPTAGKYRITITAHHVVNGKQNYSIICNGTCTNRLLIYGRF